MNVLNFTVDCFCLVSATTVSTLSKQARWGKCSTKHKAQQFTAWHCLKATNIYQLLSVSEMVLTKWSAEVETVSIISHERFLLFVLLLFVSYSWGKKRFTSMQKFLLFFWSFRKNMTLMFAKDIIIIVFIVWSRSNFSMTEWANGALEHKCKTHTHEFLSLLKAWMGWEMPVDRLFKEMEMSSIWLRFAQMTESIRMKLIVITTSWHTFHLCRTTAATSRTGSVKATSTVIPDEYASVQVQKQKVQTKTAGNQRATTINWLDHAWPEV